MCIFEFCQNGETHVQRVMEDGKVLRQLGLDN